MERSLSRAVIIKTKSLPISATTFPTALFLYIAHDGRKHKHNPTLSANKHVVQICRSSLSAAADGLADGSGERRTSPVNGIELKIAQSCRKVVPKSPLPRFQQRCLSTSRTGTLAIAKEYPLSKLFSKVEPWPFEKEININLVYSSCLKHANEMLLGDPRQSDQRTQSFHFPIVVHQSLDPAAQSSAQAPSSLFLHAEVRALDRCRRVGSTRRRGNHMHDHSRLQRDVNDVTGVSLSLSLSLSLPLTKVTDAQYRKRFRASYNRKRFRTSYNGTYSQSFAPNCLRGEQIGALFNSHSFCTVVVDVESLEDLCGRKKGQLCSAIAFGCSWVLYKNGFM